MGTWGIGSFENDIALDWAEMLMEEGDCELILLALKEIINEEDYIEVPECCEALAAVDVLGALKNQSFERLPKEFGDWLEQKSKVDEAFTNWDRPIYELGIRVAEKILAESELLEVWSDSDDLEEWQAEIRRIIGDLL